MASQVKTNDADGQNDTGTLTLPSSPPPPPGDDSVLPFELITEILWRLPVKLLMKLKCVCKSWNSLISSDRKFARKHLRMSRMNPKLILTNLSDRSLPDFFSHIVYPLSSFFTNENENGIIVNGTHINCPLNTQVTTTRIVASCDGILCLDLINNYFTLPIGTKFIHAALWNPSTGKYIVLPSFNEPPPLKNGFVKTLYSFGYDHLSDNYKLVAVSLSIWTGDTGGFTVHQTQVMLHALGTDSWRLIPEFPSVIFGADYLQSGKFLSGAINWLVPIGHQPIVSLDLGTESYQQILTPDYGEERIKFILGVSRDCLCILAGFVGRMVSDIWLMKEYGNRESWTKLVSLDSDYYNSINNVLYIFEDDQMLLEVTKAYQSELVVYDPIYSTLNTLKIQDIENFKAIFKVLGLPKIYIESLISPCS